MLYEQDQRNADPNEPAAEALPAIPIKAKQKPPKNAVARVDPSLARSRYYAETLGMTEMLHEDQYPALARAVAIAGGSGIPHPRDSDYTQISHDDVWAPLFANNRKAIKAVKGLMDTIPYGVGSHFTGYKLKPLPQALLDAAERTYVHISDGEKRLPSKHKLKPKIGLRLDGIRNAIPVNLDAAINVRDAINASTDILAAGGRVDGLLAGEVADQLERSEGNSEAVIRSLFKTRRQLNDLLSLAGGDGLLPQAFGYTTNSRWQGIDYNLQLTNKLTRKVALAEHYSYDISCCYHSIVLWLGQQGGLKLGALSHYVSHKREVRKAFKDLTGAPESNIKEVLIAIGYGAKEGGESIRDLLTPEQLTLLRADKTFKDLASDLSSAAEYIAGQCLHDADATTKDRMSIRNAQGYLKALAIGKGKNRKQIKDRQIVSHIVTGWECKALMPMIEAADTPVLPVHDCLICSTEQDMDRLKESVEAATEGLAIQLELEQYPSYLA